LADEPIRERGYVSNPDMVVVMDDSLLDDAEAGVRDGLGPTSLVVVNSTRGSEAVRQRWLLDAIVVSLDLSAIARDVVGAHVLSATAAGLAAKTGSLAPWTTLARAIAIELEEAGVSAGLIDRNLRAARRVFDVAPVVGLYERAAPPPRPARPPFEFPALSALSAAPSIATPASSLLRHTDGWRVDRPVIDESRCTRCLLCFVLCPEGAIALTPDNLPKVDYDHCKGCLICVRECPPHAIHEIREAAP
jgi:pyruvate ferredoxin oxidoreductase gamma subunit